MPIRLRITLLGALVFTVTIVLFSGCVYWVGSRNVAREQDRVLTRRTQQAAELLQRAGPDDLRPRRDLAPLDLTRSLDVFVEVLDQDGTVISSTGEVGGAAPPVPRATLDQLAAGGASTTIEPQAGVSLRLRVQPWRRDDLGRGGFLVAGQSTGSVRKQVRDLRNLLIVASVITLFVACGAIWFVLGRALRPLKTVAETATEIGRTGDLGRTLPAVQSRDEVHQLTESFNGMLRRLKDSYEKLGGALESQKRFVADASHELRTPLTTIRTNAGLLLGRSDISEEDRAAALQDIAGESERMSRLVHDLLTLARADAGQRLELSPIDLAAIVQDVCRQARTLHPSRCFAVEGDERVSLCGNADALTRLIWILVDNAVKHTPDGGHVGLWVANRAGLALLHVADDGEGIPEADLTHIFERFYQADAARSGGGAGLGLSIARWIAQEHRGRILAYNNERGGATFRVELATGNPHAALSSDS